MRKVAFICDLKYPKIWKDGLWAALQLLQKDYEVSIVNLHERIESEHSRRLSGADCIIAWSAFGGSCVKFLKDSGFVQPKLLCIGGTAAPPDGADLFEVLFYETHWYEDVIRHVNVKRIHAFGINADIYRLPTTADKDGWLPRTSKIFDIISVGSFSVWKRHELLIGQEGIRLAIGEVQKENRPESYGIIQRLLESGVMVSDMLDPYELAELYRVSKLAYIPAELHGGGERAILEARACGTPVKFETDNPKLEELSASPIYDHHYYAQQLKKGVEHVLKNT